MSDGLTIEKMKLNERLASIEIKMDALIASNGTALNMLTGNGHPEDGIVFRVTQMEQQKKDRDKQMTGVFTIVSAVVVTVIGDIIHRTFFHK